MAGKERGLALTIWLWFMLISHIVGIIAYIALGSLISRIMPVYTPSFIFFNTILLVLDIIFIIALFKWKKWGFFGLCTVYGGSTGATFVVFSRLYNMYGFMGLYSIVSSMIGILFWVGIMYVILKPKWDLLE